MSASFSVRSASGRYRVEIRKGLLERELGAGAAIVLCDERFRERFAAHKVVPVRADESAKALEAIPALIASLREHGATRDAELVAVGGGVVQDVASFAASIYMRGIAWSYFPTTLLGMADSCIGGKSSINVGAHKNLVGTFHTPKRVLIDPSFVESLSVEQRVAGLCEAAKICFARNADVFDGYLECAPGPALKPAGFVHVIALSLRAKKWFIETDEFDRAERQLLNFGHTFGHAIESATRFAIPHGIAVGIGMLCAIEFGRALGRDYGAAPVVGKLAAHTRELLAHVPTEALRTMPADLAVKAFLSDKKHTADRFVAIVPAAHGGLERTAFPRDAAHLGKIEAVFASLNRGLPS